MKNEYKICGDYTIIYLNRRNGDVLETFVDTEDLEKIQKHPYKWGPKFSKNTQTHYVNARHSKNKRLFLHRFILKTPEGYFTDHIDGNTLNNRKSNLRVCTIAENNQNKKAAYSNSKSGIRGVSFHKQTRKWQADLQMNGKTKYIGLYNSLKDAEIAIKKARALLMPFSQEALENKVKFYDSKTIKYNCA